MPPPDIAQIAAWLAATDIAELDLRGPDTHLHLRHPGAPPPAVPNPATPNPAAPTRQGLTVTAPSLGVFLHRHPLHDRPIAPIGTAVRQGQPLGLLRIGSLLLPVPAPIAGIVAGFWAAHDGLVGYGSALVELDPLPPPE